MRFSELKTHLDKAVNGGSLAVAYFLTGDDDYLLGEAERLFKCVLDPDSADMNYTRAETVDEALENLSTFPIFDMHRICLIDLIGVSEQDLNKLKNYLASPMDESVLVARVDAAAYKALKRKDAQEIVCSPLDAQELNAQILELFASPPAVAVSPDAIEELVTRTQSSLARIVSEVKKLKAYSPSGVTKADVEDMVAADIEYQTYLLTQAVSERNAPEALKMLNVILKSGIPERVLMNALYDRFRRLLHVSLNKDRSNEDIARFLELRNPKQVYYLRQNAQDFSQVRLKATVDFLHALQYETVQGMRSEASALQEAILQMLAI